MSDSALGKVLSVRLGFCSAATVMRSMSASIMAAGCRAAIMVSVLAGEMSATLDLAIGQPTRVRRTHVVDFS